MTEIDLRRYKFYAPVDCSLEDLLSFRGQFHFPVERSAVLSSIVKFPGLTVDQLHDRLQIEKSIIKDVVADLFDSGKILINLDGRLFLADSCGGK